jgi:hypothetical protein
MCELWADDRGFNDLVSIRLPDNTELTDLQDRIHTLAVGIMRDAQKQGSVRADLTPEDLAFLIWSHSRITQATHVVAQYAWRRHLYLMLDAFRADRAHPLPEPPMSPQQAYDAMISLGGTTGGQPR